MKGEGFGGSGFDVLAGNLTVDGKLFHVEQLKPGERLSFCSFLTVRGLIVTVRRTVAEANFTVKFHRDGGRSFRHYPPRAQPLPICP